MNCVSFYIYSTQQRHNQCNRIYMSRYFQTSVHFFKYKYTCSFPLLQIYQIKEIECTHSNVISNYLSTNISTTFLCFTNFLFLSCLEAFLAFWLLFNEVFFRPKKYHQVNDYSRDKKFHLLSISNIKKENSK